MVFNSFSFFICSSAWKPHRELRMGLLSVQESGKEAEDSNGKGSRKDRRKDQFNAG